MNEENILVITDREELYDKCENMEQLFDKYYLPLLDKHYSKTYKLQQENAQINQRIEKALKFMHDKEIVFSFRNVRILRDILEGTEEIGEDGEYI